MRRYLLVDDNRAFVENLAEILRDQGDEAFVVTSGSQGLGLIPERKFDALVTDMRMPVMGGAQLVHEIRRLDPGWRRLWSPPTPGRTISRRPNERGFSRCCRSPFPSSS